MVTCGDCLKPRCIYSAAKLSSSELDAVNQAKEDNFYVCGSELFPPDHSLNVSVVVRRSILCQSPMETTYYSATSINFPDACFYCGQSDPQQLLDDSYINELKQEYATVRPLCI